MKIQFNFVSVQIHTSDYDLLTVTNKTPTCVAPMDRK
jgi:hypothetical protein